MVGVHTTALDTQCVTISNQGSRSAADLTHKYFYTMGSLRRAFFGNAKGLPARIADTGANYLTARHIDHED